MLNMGYTRQAVEDSITHQKYDDVQATYLLLGRRTSDVSFLSEVKYDCNCEEKASFDFCVLKRALCLKTCPLLLVGGQ